MTIEVSAKKVDDAINQGLKQLGASLDEVNVEVVDAGGLFRKAKVRLTLERDGQTEAAEEPAPAAPQKPNAEKAEKPQEQKKHAAADIAEDKSTEKSGNVQKTEKTVKSDKPADKKPTIDKRQNAAESKAEKPQSGAKQGSAEDGAVASHKKQPRKLTDEDRQAAAHALEFVKTAVGLMGFESAVVEADESGELLTITAPEGDDSLLIGRHGETLAALSYLAETCARAEKSHVGITVDCNGYCDRRAASLTAMAKRRANECVAKHRKIKLEPMGRADRRTVHNALTGDERVSTASEGKEPHRYVVIIPKN